MHASRLLLVRVLLCCRCRCRRDITTDMLHNHRLVSMIMCLSTQAYTAQKAPPLKPCLLIIHLRSGLFLLLLPQSAQTNTRDLDHLESDTGNITLGLALSTETGDEDFVVLVDEVEATIVGD